MGRSLGCRVAVLALALVAAQFPSALPLIGTYAPRTAAAAPIGRVFVGNQGGTVSAIDPTTNTVIATIDLGGGGAYGVAVRPGGSQVWVAIKIGRAHG